MRRGPRQAGFALLVVLWTLGFLSLLGGGLVAMARQNTQRFGNLLDAAVTEAAAEGGLHQAIFALLDTGDQHWRADGTPHALRIGQALVALRLEDEGGKVNPNIAEPELLQALLLQLGPDRRTSAALAGAIIDWRSVAQGPTPPGAKAAQYAAADRDYAPPGAPFESLDELGLVLGMTPDLLARLRPHLTLHTTVGPDVATDDPVVAAAIGAPRPAPPRRDGGEAPHVVSVQVEARGPGGAVHMERVVVRINARGDVRRYEILARQPLAVP